MVTEGSVNVTTLAAFLTLLSELAEERLLVKGVCPGRDVGFATGIGRAD